MNHGWAGLARHATGITDTSHMTPMAKETTMYSYRSLGREQVGSGFTEIAMKSYSPSVAVSDNL